MEGELSVPLRQTVTATALECIVLNLVKLHNILPGPHPTHRLPRSSNLPFLSWYIGVCVQFNGLGKQIRRGELAARSAAQHMDAMRHVDLGVAKDECIQVRMGARGR